MLTLKRGDDGIGIKATLSNTLGCLDLTDTSVLFLFDDYEIPAQITDAENGEVLVVFEHIHTSKTGVYRGEFEVTFNDGRIETFPNDSYLNLKIMQDLGGTS